MKLNFSQVIEKFNSLDTKVRYIIFGIFLLLVVAVDYAMIMQFQLGALRAMSAQIHKIDGDIEGVKTDKQRIGQIKQNLEFARIQMKELESKIRSIAEGAMISEEITRIASESHMTIDQISPTKEGQESLVTIGNKKYFALPIVLNLHSGYHMFGLFLNKLSSGSLLFTVKSLKMEGGDKENANIAIQSTLKIIMADASGESK